MTTKDERRQRVLRTLGSLKCTHPRNVRSTDGLTGREFCGDCGDWTEH